MRPLVIDIAFKMHEHMSNNDDARAQDEYKWLISRGVDPKQFAEARLRMGTVNAEATEIGAQEKFVKLFYYEDASARGYLPADTGFETCTLDDLRAAEETFYGNKFPEP